MVVKKLAKFVGRWAIDGPTDSSTKPLLKIKCESRPNLILSEI